MERNRDTLLLALYALPNPPDWELINRRACSAAKEPEEGSAASRSVEVGVVASCGRGGSVEGEPSLGAARANCGMYPVGRKRSGNGEGARDDGGVQHVPDNFRLDDTGKGRGAAGEPLRAPENFRLDYSRKGRGAAPENFLFDTAKKGRGAGRQCFLNKNLRSGHDAEEEGRAHGGLLLYRQDIDDRGCKNGAAAFGSVASSAGVPCSRGVSTATGEFFTMEKHRRVCDDKEHNAAGGCFGFNEEVPYNSNAPEVWPHSHPSHAMEKYDPVPELLLCCGEVLSKPWRSIWQETPLVFHDKKLVRPLVILKAASPGVVLNLTEQITNILEKHPCSIPYFRMDSSSWTGGQSKLSEWLTILSKKKASEIIIVNREEARSLEFPLDDMQSPCLTSLRLGFFSLQDLDIYCFNYSNLGTLDLIGCSFESIRLYYVIKDCKNLTHLGIGLSVKDVRISSESLEEIQIWKCNMTHLSIEFAPRLQKLVNGIHPIWKRYHVLVMIQETPALQEFENLLLPIHRVEDQLWMRSLKKIALGIQMCNRSQRELMSEYLQCAPSLQELCIWRMDDIGPSEELDAAVDDSLLRFSGDLPCLSSLLMFVIDGFRGGGVEISVASAILKYAVCLNELRLQPCPASDKEPIVKAFLELRRVKRASVKCLLRLPVSNS